VQTMPPNGLRLVPCAFYGILALGRSVDSAWEHKKLEARKNA
jgi:hypothetical protein